MDRMQNGTPVSTASVTFRHGNELIAARLADAAGEHAISFICECSDPTCFGSVHLTLEQYRRLRTAFECFLALRGHGVDGAELETDGDAAVWRPRGA